MKAALFLLARAALGLDFLRMGASKVADPVAFLKLLREYDMVPLDPPWLINAMAVSLPWVEILLGLAVLLGVGTRGAATALAGLLTLFSGVIVLRTLGLMDSDGLAFCEVAFDCGCGSGEVVICHKLLQNGGLLVAALIAALSRLEIASLRPRLAGRPD